MKRETNDWWFEIVNESDCSPHISIKQRPPYIEHCQYVDIDLSEARSLYKFLGEVLTDSSESEANEGEG